MPEDYALNLEEMKRMMANAMGTNLAGQSMAGPVATGQAYAQQIAGGMPMEQVIAPGVSYSPEMAGGYTQADLDMIARGPAPVMPVAPTQETPLETSYETMPDAPVGTPAPERYVPGQTPFPGIPDYIRNLDFSNLPRFEDIQDIRGVENIRPSLFDIDVEEILKDIDTEKFADIDFSNINIPSVVPTMPTAPAIQQPITPVVQEPTPIGDIRDTYTPEQVAELERKEIERRAREEANIINKYGSRENLQNQINESLFKDFVTPQTPVIPEPVMQQPVRQEVPFVPEIPTIPMNFTGLPQMPAIPNIPVMPELPIVPQPIQPMNFTRLSNLPVSNFVQPSVEDIVSPISRGRTLPKTPRGLFTL
ncbi:hypothetical protein N9Y18_06480 [Litoricolaceae bacterium]|nr:hypothetical protein [Litorivicinaceae bacterium]